MFVKVFRSNDRRSFEGDINSYIKEVQEMSNCRKVDVQYAQGVPNNFSYNAMVIVYEKDDKEVSNG